MIERLKYWLFQRGKDCKHCCLWCEYYDICNWDVVDRKGKKKSYKRALSKERWKALYRECRKERREHEKL